MTTYTITIDEKNIAGKHFLNFIKTLPYISFVKNEKKKKNGIDEALEDIKMGRVSEPMTIEEYNIHLDNLWQKIQNEI